MAAVGYRERCCIHASCCLTTLNVSAASSGVLSAPHPRTGQGPQLISPREMQQLIWSSACPHGSRPQCMRCAADDRGIAAPGKCYAWAVQLELMRRVSPVQPDCSWGTWCSGITSAPHAEGPGLKSQCVHWRVRSAAAAAVGVQGTLLHPCFVLSYYAQRLCRLFWGALCPHPRTGQRPQLISPREMQQLIWSSACPAAARRSACAVLLTTRLSPHLGSVTHGLYSS